MNGNDRTAPPLLVELRMALRMGMLMLAIAVPWTAAAAAADEPQSAPAAEKKPPEMSPEARLLPDPPGAESFGPQPDNKDPYKPEEQLGIYSGKHMNKTSFPLVDLGLQLYERGAYEPRPTLFGRKNPVMAAFMAYGDIRFVGANYNPGAGNNQSVIAARLNLDMDYQLTATERLHAFVRPLDKGGKFTRYQISGGTGGDNKFFQETNFDLKTLFFEGDLAAIAQGVTGEINRHDKPIAIGRVPIATQNGIWIDDAIDGGAIGLFTAKNSSTYDISNFDVTFFAGFNNVNTAAVPNSAKNKLFALAGFADARKGYFEWGYGYLDANNNDLSYHNVTAAFTKRYRNWFSNSVRVIGNFGQKGIGSSHTKTADGVLLLIENSLITSKPSNVVPYFDFFAGFKSPQALARAADAGGALKNTGINFETDGVTAFPKLDDTARDSYGGALGLDYLFPDFSNQLVVEAAVVERRGDNPLGNQYAIGARFQHRINHAWIIRFDAMKGWIQGQKDIYGARIELRRKF